MADPVNASTVIIGLGTLAALKAATLPAPIASTDTFDAMVSAIGKSVASRFEHYTSRKFCRKAGRLHEQPGDCSYLSLPGLPVEVVSKVEFLPYGQGVSEVPAWQDYTADVYLTLNRQAGLLDFGYSLGTGLDTIRVTYTGGYWIPYNGQDGLTPVAVPAGARLLPDDLFGAWSLQCATEFQARDILGTGVIKSTEARSATVNFATGLDLAPEVRATLDSYRRF